MNSIQWQSINDSEHQSYKKQALHQVCGWKEEWQGKISAFWQCWTVKSSLHLMEQQPEAAGAVCFCTSSAWRFLTFLGLRFSSTLKFSPSCVKLLFKAQPTIVLLEKLMELSFQRNYVLCHSLRWVSLALRLLESVMFFHLCSWPALPEIHGNQWKISVFFIWEKRRCTLVFLKNYIGDISSGFVFKIFVLLCCSSLSSKTNRFNHIGWALLGTFPIT